MPSEIASGIVDHIFSDEKSRAIDATNDALAATTYDLIQQKKAEFAARMGFDLDQTAQAAADDLEDKLVDDGSGETKVEPAAQRMPHEPPPEEEAPGTPSSVEEPEAELEQEPTDEPTVEEEPEEDETNS